MSRSLGWPCADGHRPTLPVSPSPARRWGAAAIAGLGASLAIAVICGVAWYSMVSGNEHRVFTSAAAGVTATVDQSLRRTDDFVVTMRAWVAEHPNATPAQFNQWFALVEGHEHDLGSLGVSIIRPGPVCRMTATAPLPAAVAHTPMPATTATPGDASAPGPTAPPTPGSLPSPTQAVARIQRAGAQADWCSPGWPLSRLLRIDTDSGQLGVHTLPGALLKGTVVVHGQQALARAPRAGTELAALYIDLDGFKAVNDELGHAAGDELLREVSRRLRAALRAGDLPGRLGGDEFVALLDTSATDDGPEAVAQRVIEAIAAPVEVPSRRGRRRCMVTASVGIASGPRASIAELLADADAALYRAKRLGKNRWASAGSRSASRRRITAGEDRRRATSAAWPRQAAQKASAGGQRAQRF